jgi:hypothetical protein
VPNRIDNCPYVYNPDQRDMNRESILSGNFSKSRTETNVCFVILI